MKIKEYEVIYEEHWGFSSICVRCYNKEEAKEMFIQHYPEYKDSIHKIRLSK